MLIVCAVVLIGLGAAAFLCDFSDESSSNESSGINSTKTSSEDNKKDTGKSKDAEKGKESGDDKDTDSDNNDDKSTDKKSDQPGNSDSKKVPPKQQYLVIDANGVLKSSVKDVKIKLDGKNLSDFPVLPCKSHRDYIIKLEQFKKCKEIANTPTASNGKQPIKIETLSGLEAKIEKKYAALTTENIDNISKDIDKLFDEYRKNFYALMNSKNFTRSRSFCDDLKRHLGSYTQLVDSNKTVFKGKETENLKNLRSKWKKADADLKIFWTYKSNPDNFYKREKENLANAWNDVCSKIQNEEIKQILGKYFIIDENAPQQLTPKRLEELAKELNKFVEVDRQQSSKQQVVRRSPDASAQKKQGK